jgi:glyoxylate/hydroxypyruvate reductase
LGRIGEAVAHRLKAFGISQVLYSGRSEKPEASKRLQAQFVPFDELLAKSDYVVVCCALTEETKEMFNYDAFKKMKRSAVSMMDRDAIAEKYTNVKLNNLFIHY